MPSEMWWAILEQLVEKDGLETKFWVRVRLVCRAWWKWLQEFPLHVPAGAHFPLLLHYFRVRRLDAFRYLEPEDLLACRYPEELEVLDLTECHRLYSRDPGLISQGAKWDQIYTRFPRLRKIRVTGSWDWAKPLSPSVISLDCDKLRVSCPDLQELECESLEARCFSLRRLVYYRDWRGLETEYCPNLEVLVLPHFYWIPESSEDLEKLLAELPKLRCLHVPLLPTEVREELSKKYRVMFLP